MYVQKESHVHARDLRICEADTSRIPSLCSLPLKTLAQFSLMNQSITWRVWLVNISGQLWLICSIQPLLIGLGSLQHTSAILDYAHDLFSVQSTLYTLQKYKAPLEPPSPRSVVISEKILEKCGSKPLTTRKCNNNNNNWFSILFFI